MVFRRGGRLAYRERWTYRNCPIEVVSKFKYLGVTFSTGHVKKVLGKASKVVFMMRRLMYGFGRLPLKFILHLFDVLVVPVVLYGSEIWGHYAKSDMDLIERKFYRMILGLPRGCPGAALGIELGTPLSVYWKAQVRPVSYWIKLLKMEHGRLAKLAYQRQRELASEGTQCWATKLKDVLDLCEHGDTYVNENPVLPQFLNEIKERITQQAADELWAEVHEKTSLIEYCELRLNRAPETHLLSLPHSERRLLLTARLNLPTLINLTTVSGERVRKCRLCDTTIENPYWKHILWECLELEDSRNILTQIELPITNQNIGINTLFTTSDIGKLLAIGKFLIMAEKLAKQKSRRVRENDGATSVKN